jgi:hypothetical protein
MEATSQPDSWKKAVKAGLIAYLGLRVWTSIVLLLLAVYPSTVLPADEPARGTLTALEQGGLFSRLILAPWYRWDTVHYLDLAQNGYNRVFLSVWPPLYSGLIHLLSLTGLTPMLAAVIVSNLCAIAALTLLFRMANDLTEGSGGRLLLYLAVFPTAFFLVAAYSEALFIALAAACLWTGWRGRLWLAGLLAALAVLTRLQGAILAVPLLYEGLVSYRHMCRGRSLKDEVLSLAKVCLPAALPVIMAAGFTMYVRFGLNEPWPWLTLSAEWGQHTGWPWEGLVGNVTSLFGLRNLTTPINPLAQTMDLAAVVFAAFVIVLMALRRREFPLMYTLYAAAGLLVMLMKLDNQGLLVSASRYTLSLFPIFLYMAVKRREPLPKWGNLLLVSTGLTAQAVLLVCFARWIWIA